MRLLRSALSQGNESAPGTSTHAVSPAASGHRRDCELASDRFFLLVKVSSSAPSIWFRVPCLASKLSWPEKLCRECRAQPSGHQSPLRRDHTSAKYRLRGRRAL